MTKMTNDEMTNDEMTNDEMTKMTKTRIVTCVKILPSAAPHLCRINFEKTMHSKTRRHDNTHL